MKLTKTIRPGIIIIVILITFIHSDLFAQWKWINPLPQGNHLNGISFVNDSVGWIIGDEGVILKTIDFGKTWGFQSADSAVDLNEVCFVNKNAGYIIGDNGYLIKTLDGGQSWKRIPFPSTDANGSLYFKDELKGWVSGSTSIFATRDGGKNWTHFDFWIWDYIWEICFVDSLNGYRAGRFIKKTVDGGINWTDLPVFNNLPVTSDYPDVFFISKDTGWVIGSHPFTGCLIARTNDGGKTWSSTELAERMSQVCFLNKDTGFAVGGDGILKSVDGGSSWKKISNLGCYSISMTRSKGYTAGNNGLIAATPSHSGNWNPVTKDIINHKNLHSLFFNDPLLGFAVGDSGTVLRTQDGGKTWDNHVIDSTLPLTSVFFTDASSGWISAREKILHTSNGGDDWQVSYKHDSRSEYSDIFFINSDTGWVACNAIFHTTDRGKTWSQQNVYQETYSIYFINSNVGWAVGYSGRVAFTTNGGKNWTTKNVPTTESLYHVRFYNEKIGWIVGDRGVILKTADGGNTWVIQSLFTADKYFLKQISIIDSLNISVLGFYPTWDSEMSFNTRDGGVTWEKMDNPCNIRLHSLIQLDANKWFAAGNSGTLLEYQGKSGIPGYPWQLTATTLSTNKIELKWQDNSSNETGYEIRRSNRLSGNYKMVCKTGPNITAYTDSLLNASTSYWYRVRAYNSTGKSAWSREDSATTRTNPTPPGVPDLVGPDNYAMHQPTDLLFKWRNSPGATSYHLQVCDNPDFINPFFDKANITDTSKMVVGLSKDKSYYWRVNASNSIGTSNWSSFWSLFTIDFPPDKPTLYWPSNQATNQPPQIEFSFYANRALTYRLQVDDNIDFKSTFFDQGGITGSSQQVNGLSLNTTYYWRVVAINEGGTSEWSEIWSLTTIPPVPDVPNLSTPLNSSVNQPVSLMLIWNPAPGALRYYLQVSTDPEFGMINVNLSGLGETSQRISGLSNKTKYYWRIRAENGGAKSAWSEVWNFTTTNPVGINELSLDDQVKIYPNPANGKISVEFSQPVTGDTEIKLYEPSGRLMLAGKLVSVKSEIDISDLTHGIYIVEIRSGTSVYNKKLAIF